MNANRVSGFDIVGDIPWGTHFCQFYQTDKELMDVVIPYFKAGLENNESCIWVTSEYLSLEEAQEVLKKAIPDFGIYVERKQIEVIPYPDWYLKEGIFNSERILDFWVGKLNQALNNGYKGLRAIENIYWLEKEDLSNFVNYQRKLGSIIAKRPIISLCTYSLDKCNITEIIDITANHQFILVKEGGNWKQIKNSARKNVIELERRETICEAIELINQIIHSTLDFDEIMQKTVSEAARAIGCETAAISLRESRHWVLRYAYGFPQDVIGTEMDEAEEPHAVLAIKTKKPVAINDTFKNERVNRNHMKKWGVRSVLVVPLVTKDEVVGVLFFNYHKYTFAFDDNDLYFASQLSSSISLALENSRLFENLKMELAERKRTEEALRENEKQLVADLDVMKRLQKLGTLFVREGNLETVLGEIVDTAIAISNADFGNIQLLDPASSDLKIVAQRGFPEWWLDFWNRVSMGRGTCGTALGRGERVIVEDIEQSPIFAGTSSLEVQLKVGVRAVQSTPLVSRSGRPLGMFSTHYRMPHRPDDSALRLLDLLARHAADIIERAQIEEELYRVTEHERFLADVVEKANVPFGVGTPDGRLLMFNQAFVDLTGYTHEELTQKQLTWNTDLTPLEWRDNEAARLAEASSTHQPVRYEKEYLRKDGKRVPVELFVQPVFDIAGNLIHYRTFLTDITEREQEERKILRYNRTLEGINQIFGSVVKAETEEELGQVCLSVAMELTGSQIGFVSKVGIDGLLHDIAISDIGWEQCTMYDKTGHRHSPGDFILHGLYGSVIDTGKSFFTNDPRSHPDSIGLPYGHPPIKSFLGTPLLLDGKTIGTLVVSNREGGYDHEQQEDLEAIVPAVTQALQRKKAEETLAKIDIARQKEIHHRIKNNLQVISSLLDLQAEKFNNRECINDSEILKALRESQDRVSSIALIHEELYKGEGFETLNFSPYLEKLVQNLLQTYKLGSVDINLIMGLEENFFLNMDIAVPLGMIVNELVSNSLKYAFPNRKTGEVQIKLFKDEKAENSLNNNEKEVTEKGTKYTLIISDNGVGISQEIDLENLDTLGLQLVTILVEQLDGKIELKRNKGTEFKVRFNIEQN